MWFVYIFGLFTCEIRARRDLRGECSGNHRFKRSRYSIPTPWSRRIAAHLQGMCLVMSETGLTSCPRLKPIVPHFNN
jgi:hypothetical protein